MYILCGGEGPESYNQQSSYQRALLEVAKEKMTEAISANLNLDLISNQFSIADFGCASGPNTFVSVQNIIDAVEEKYRRETGQNPANNIKFQVLFNDFSINDFNTLFQTLPQGRRYYSAGWDSWFLSRLWIMDRDSPLWNKDMQCTGYNQAVKKRILINTLSTPIILDARAEELVPGG
ncbi:predicted protein [Arabidopsis lyrata subsp. lyrata]|uniref:Predicted protein n=1 Tax=Arabidopsis lyrata subsp. lyrata TaxID=81972 RepID=D7KUC6_ARALL|nr:predicted protein [Arabidopsis lyrata subsp. lyrata]